MQLAELILRDSPSPEDGAFNLSLAAACRVHREERQTPAFLRLGDVHRTANYF
jgi:hypothetical protein